MQIGDSCFIWSQYKGLSWRATRRECLSVAEWAPEGKGARFQRANDEEFQEAVAFLAATRCFLHYRHERDRQHLGLASAGRWRRSSGLIGWGPGNVDAAFWMRAYFRHARIIEKYLLRAAEMLARGRICDRDERIRVPEDAGFQISAGVLELKKASASGDASYEPEIVLSAFRRRGEWRSAVTG